MSNRTTSISGPRSATVADILERVLDKGVVIAGDIKIRLVEIELLTIQIRLVVCSVERAMAMGMDFWRTDPSWSALAGQASPQPALGSPSRDVLAAGMNPVLQQKDDLAERVQRMEELLLRMEQRMAKID